MSANTQLPEVIESEAALDEVLTRPSARLVEFMRTLPSPLVILGAAGKMGPTLAVLARRAAEAAGHRLTVIAVSRFSDERVRSWLTERGVQTIACDLLDRRAVAGLPDAANVIYLAGLKFGTATQPARTWATNTLAPALVSEHYARGRIVALSTGNVYPLAPFAGSGSAEGDPLTPLGEYSNSCVGRERIFEYYSARNATPMALIRLSYAVELRYGVLADIARRVYAGEAIDVTNSRFQCIWQGDANEMIIRALGLAGVPPFSLNLTSTALYSIRGTALRFGELLGRPVKFSGAEMATGLFSNTDRLLARLGGPATPVEAVIRWTAHWIAQGGRSLNKPTHFEVRDGEY
jgi:hypothetical protein